MIDMMSIAEKKIVISQPMFFPWRGLFEQIALADIYVHYDDVQYPLGRSFMSRVQVKTPDGIQWLSVPIKNQGIQLIKDVTVDESQDWRSHHKKVLKHMYGKAPYYKEMISLVESIYCTKTNSLSELNIHSIEKISDYLGISPTFTRSSNLKSETHGSEKLLEIVKKLGGDTYITGHGALNYLDYDLFEANEVRVEYIDYLCSPYPQMYGGFNPYVSILDLIANTGNNSIHYVNSPTKYWRDFIDK